MQIDHGAAPRILPPKVAADRAGVSLRTLQRMVRNDEFPKPVMVSRNRIGFFEASVNTWIASRPQVS